MVVKLSFRLGDCASGYFLFGDVSIDEYNGCCEEAALGSCGSFRLWKAMYLPIRGQKIEKIGTETTLTKPEPGPVVGHKGPSRITLSA
jgi:hypothetical protein